MSRRPFAMAAVCALAALSPARAQSGLGIAAGGSFPTSDFGRVADPGYHITGLAHIAKHDSPFALRLDGTFSQYNYPSDLHVPDASTRLLYGTANLVISATGGMGPYVIGGAGIYYSAAECTGCTTSATNGGYNAGGGLRFALSGFSAFVEARYHVIPGGSDPTTAGTKKNAAFVPISFGLIF
jgi:hypothetical protein